MNWKFRALLLAGISASALGLTACTNSQEQATITAINNTCLEVGPGGTIAASIVSSLDPALAPVAQLGAVLTNEISLQCPAFIAAVTAVIDDVNGLGGTATVSVSTTTATGLRHHYRMQVRKVAGVYVVPPGGLFGEAPHIYVVPPNH